jgi:hypothetical protein
MRRDTKIQALAALIMALCMSVAGVMATRLAASAGRNHLVYSDTAESGEPPEVALGIAMGAFRGVFVNFLWIRANNLKEAGRHYEAVELAKAITRLQPRFPQVWVFHAWNLSYNISVMTQTASERWRWVRAGIGLLRDEAIPANPNDLLLHKELAYIYLHKIQGITDDANQFYKRQMAKEWQIVLGPPPAPDRKDRSREMAIKKYVDWLQPLVDAPATLDEVIAAQPLVRTLIDRLEKEVGDPLDTQFLTRLEMHHALNSSGRRDAVLTMMGPKHAAFSAIYLDKQFEPAFAALVPYIRRNVLRDLYKMDPRIMIRYTQKYGPIDWRHPCAHALYWSALGVERAETRWTEQNKRDFDFVNADRMTFQAVQELWRSGEIYFSFLDSLDDSRYTFYLAAPNVHFIQTYDDILSEVVSRSAFDTKDKAFSFYNAGYENFMKDAIRFYYRRGQTNEAARLKSKLARWEGQNLNDPMRAEHFSMPLDEFVMWDLGDRATSPNVANAEIMSSLMGAYVTGLLAGDDELFRQQFQYAQKFHAYYVEKQSRQTIADPSVNRMEVFDRNFSMLAGIVLGQFAVQLDLDQAETLYATAPVELRRFAYDLLANRFKNDLDAVTVRGARKFDEVFPEPPDMDLHRRAVEAYVRQRSKESTVTEK